MSRMDERICLACRSTTLSRYNPEPLCAPCARASRDCAGIVPTWLWDSPPMREALARIDIPAFVAIFRAASDLSQLELSNLIPGWSLGRRHRRHGLTPHRPPIKTTPAGPGTRRTQPDR